MKYTILQCQPKDAEKKLNALAADGWKVVSQSESVWPIKKCFGLSNEVDSIVTFTLAKE